jgi:hypothetical protein
MRPEKLLSRHALSNGLTLEFWDQSHPTAGDRWQVAAKARIAMPVIPAHLPPELQDRLEEVRAALGSEAVFAKQEIRIFVAAGEVPGLLKQIEADLLASLRRYLGHPEFAPRFIRRKYQDFQERQSWLQHVPEAEEN